MNEQTRGILTRAYERYVQGSTQGAFARAPDGTACGSGDPEAVAWCLIGAIVRACHELEIDPSAPPAWSAWAAVREAIPGGCARSLSFFNDTRSREEVLTLFQCVLGKEER